MLHKCKDVERECYWIVKDKFEELFKSRGIQVYLEVTASGKFSDRIKSVVPRGKEIVFLFLRQVAPDITGFVEIPSKSVSISTRKFVVIEVKREVRLGDVYQLKKYADLFDASFAFLVSLSPISEEIKRVFDVCMLFPKLRGGNIYQAFVITYFDINSKEFMEWFDENPFTKDIYWRGCDNYVRSCLLLGWQLFNT